MRGISLKSKRSGGLFLEPLEKHKSKFETIVIPSVAGLIALSIILLLNSAYIKADSGPWVQTSWDNGLGSSTVDQYLSSDSVEVSLGKVTLPNDEKFTNREANTDPEIDSWLGTSPSQYGNLKIWLDASRELYYDDGVPATNAQTVKTWPDQSGENNHAIQSNGSLRATYYSSLINNRPGLAFSGENKLYDISNVASDFTDSATYFLIHFVVNDFQYGLFSTVNGGDGYDRYSSNGLSYPDLFSGNGARINAYRATPAYGLVNINGTVSNSLFVQWLNGVAGGTVSSYTFGLYGTTSIQLGRSRGYAAGYFTGYMSEFIVYSSILSSTERLAIENYLNNKYDINRTFNLDTTTKYAGAGSIKVTNTGAYNADVAQSLNTVDTLTHNLSAYVYTTGAAVTSTDAELYSNGSVVATTYQSVGGGWYRLSGTVAGASSLKDYGVRVKPTKTAYVDNLSLNNLPVEGKIVSNIYDSGQLSNWNNLDYTANLNDGDIEVRVRTSNNSDMSGATDFSLCDEVTNGSDISSNNCVSDNNRYVQYEVTLISNGSFNVPELLDISIDYDPAELIDPDVNATNISIAGVVSGDWIKYKPVIYWDGGSDNIGGSGLLGYCISLEEAILDTSVNLDPSNAGGILTGLDDGIARDYCPYIIEDSPLDVDSLGVSLVSGKEYFFSIKAVDLAGNFYSGDSIDWRNLISFKYDNVAPSLPEYVSMPSNFIGTKDATFTWPVVVGGATDAHSQLAGLQYRINIDGTWYGDSHNGNEDTTDVLVNDGAYTTDPTYDYPNIEEGSNLIYVRTIDNAGNVSAGTISGALKINTTAPGEVQDLSVTPTDNTVNEYAFEWEPPVIFSGIEENISYCYSVNSLPSDLTCNFTNPGVTTLSTDAFATQPGSNRMYIVARDEALNINYDTIVYIDFTYSGSAPGIPLNLDVSDISVKAANDWKLAITWQEPTDIGAGVTSYKVYRAVGEGVSCSSSFGSFSLTSTVTGTSFIDTSLSQEYYSYCVKACDSANSCSASSSSDSEYPEGKFTEPPTLIGEPSVSQITTRKAVISWTTDRDSDSKIQYGTSENTYFEEEVSISAQVNAHTLALNNLEPGTTYFYRAKWTDEDGNTGVSNEKTFTTNPPPILKEATTPNIFVDSVIIKFTSINSYKARIYYGLTSSFGSIVDINTSPLESSYTNPIGSLTDGTKYFYKVNLLDIDGREYEGDIYSFTTIPRPRVSDIEIQEVKETAQPTIEVFWNTNTPTSSILTYSPSSNPTQERDVVELELLTEHSMQLSGLLPNSTYLLFVKGVDAIGNEAVSTQYQFTTATDSRSPRVFNIKVEGLVSDNASTNNAQLIVSWETDELSSSQVDFGDGSTPTYPQTTQIDRTLGFKHVVIIPGLKPSSVYHFRVSSEDSAGNIAKSTNNVTITPKQSDRVLDIVIRGLEDIFNFL